MTAQRRCAESAGKVSHQLMRTAVLQPLRRWQPAVISGRLTLAPSQSAYHTRATTPLLSQAASTAPPVPSDSTSAAASVAAVSEVDPATASATPAHNAAIWSASRASFPSAAELEEFEGVDPKKAAARLFRREQRRLKTEKRNQRLQRITLAGCAGATVLLYVVDWGQVMDVFETNIRAFHARLSQTWLFIPTPPSDLAPWQHSIRSVVPSPYPRGDPQANWLAAVAASPEAQLPESASARDEPVARIRGVGISGVEAAEWSRRAALLASAHAREEAVREREQVAAGGGLIEVKGNIPRRDSIRKPGDEE